MKNMMRNDIDMKLMIQEIYKSDDKFINTIEISERKVIELIEQVKNDNK